MTIEEQVMALWEQLDRLREVADRQASSISRLTRERDEARGLARKYFQETWEEFDPVEWKVEIDDAVQRYPWLGEETAGDA